MSSAVWSFLKNSIVPQLWRWVNGRDCYYWPSRSNRIGRRLFVRWDEFEVDSVRRLSKAASSRSHSGDVRKTIDYQVVTSISHKKTRNAVLVACLLSTITDLENEYAASSDLPYCCSNWGRPHLRHLIRCYSIHVSNPVARYPVNSPTNRNTTRL